MCYGESDTIPAQKQTELRQAIRTNSIQYTTHALQTTQLAHADDECFELMNSYYPNRFTRQKRLRNFYKDNDDATYHTNRKQGVPVWSQHNGLTSHPQVALSTRANRHRNTKICTWSEFLLPSPNRLQLV